MLRQTDYPKSITFDDDDVWTVHFVRKMPRKHVRHARHDGAKGKIIGLTVPETQQVLILQGLEPLERLEIFVHEVFHVLEFQFDITIDHKLIYALQKPVARMILDNFFT